jgi:hypothetical protein
VRKKFVTALTVGTIGLSGLVLAGPALSAVGAPNAAAVASAPVDRIKDALSGLVADKTLTQAQADKVASTLKSAGVGRGGKGGFGGGHSLGAAATALGMTEAELMTALQSGKTLAEVAKDKSVSVDTLIQALVTAEKERIAQKVTDGVLTQAQADEWLADLTARVTDKVNSTRPMHGGRMGGFKGKDGAAKPSTPPSASPSTAPSEAPSASPSVSPSSLS